MTSVLALGLTKLSFLCFYRRIFCKTKRQDFTNIFTAIMIFVTAGWTVSFFFAHLFACGINFSAWWGSPIDLISKCVKTEKLLEALAISDFLTDAIILVIPLPLVRFRRATPQTKAEMYSLITYCIDLEAPPYYSPKACCQCCLPSRWCVSKT